MARVLYVYDDKALGSLGASISGSPSANASFPAINVLSPDRKVVWRTAATPGVVNLDIDLGAAFSDVPVVIGGWGVHYLRTEAPLGSGPNVTVYSSSTDFSSLSLQGTLDGTSYWHSSRDWVDSASSPLTNQRYWRVRFDGGGWPFSVGKVVLGVTADFGMFYSPGSGYEVMVPGNVARTMDHDPVILRQGEARKVFHLIYNHVTTERLVLDEIARQTVPLSLLDSDGKSYHVVVERGTTKFQHVFGASSGLWSVPELVLEQMP
jgi:hypothetical protein